MENSASPSGQSSYPTPTGRPSLWSGSDQRKLARLYVYTTLPIQKILSVLQISSDTDGHPGKDSANKKLNAMLDKEPRWLHPRTRTDMDRRMQELERSPVRTQAPDAFGNGGRPHGNSVSSSHMSRSSATRDIKEENGISPTIMTTVEVPEPVAPLGSMLAMNATTSNNYTNAMEWAPSPAAPVNTAHAYRQPLHLDTDMMDLDAAAAANDEPLGLAPLEPPRPNRFSAHLRRRSTAMTGATDTTTNTLRQALSEYSDGFIRNVKKVIKRYTMPPQFELAAASAISPVSDLRPQTADSTRGSWLYDENAPAAKHSAGYLPGDFLCLDRLLVAQGFCAPGMPEHDARACLCHVRDEANPSFWVTQHGPAEWIAGLLAGGIRDRTQLELRDPFGNSVLHLFAARDGPGMPLLLALQVASAAEMNVCNNAGQTFLHVLHNSWFVDMGPAGPLMQLLGNLRQVAQFDVYRRDVYGRNFFHILQMKVPDQATLNFVLMQYDAGRYCRRDAFGMAPHRSDEAAPAQGIRRAYTAMDGSGTGAPASFADNHNPDLDASNQNVLLADAADRSQGIRFPSATDAITRQTQLLQLMQKAYDRPDVEDAHGRNALHCLSAAVLNPQTLAARFACEPRPVHLSATGPSAASSAATNSGTGTNPRRRADQTARQRKLERLDSTRAQLERRGNLAEGFLASGVDANHYDGDGNTVLMAFAAQLPEDDDYKVPVEILQMLLDSGRADLHARNRHGETALHVAVRRGRKLATRTLVQAGANVHARDADGRSVLDVADLKILRAKDEKMYAHFEACRAWLSGQGRAVQYPTVLQEWGLGPAGRTAM